MFNLQIALDERLAALKNKKIKPRSQQNVQLIDTSKSYIEHSLKQAGILDKNGKMINRIFIP